jgi:hypothetical protein
MKKLNHTKMRLMMIITVYLLIGILLITSVTFAWFTLTNENKAVFVAEISGVEAEYEFYIYNDPTFYGSSNLTLINNTTIDEEEYNKYLKVADPTTAQIIPGYAAPGDVFSFAIKVTNVGTTTGKLDLALSNIVSYGYDLEVNKIQTAFEYGVTQISYINNNVESSDQKDILNLNYTVDHFESTNNETYDLITDVPLGYITDTVVVIYFDLTFDPHIYGEDASGTPYTNSNIFMGQTILVNTIYMNLSA